MLALLSSCGGEQRESAAAQVDEFGFPLLQLEQAASELSVSLPQRMAETPAGDEDPDDLITNVYAIPSTFFDYGRLRDLDSLSLDPFSDKKTAKQLFESYGVVFGPGTKIFTGSATKELVIRQTRDQMNAVEAILEEINVKALGASRTINVRIEIFELPAVKALKLQDEANSKADHKEEWKAVMELMNKGNARFVTSATAGAQAGKRARFSDAQEVVYAVEFDWEDPNKQRDISGLFETRDVGTVLEIKPVIGDDGKSVELAYTFEYHSALPGEKRLMIAIPHATEPVEVSAPVFHAKKISSELTVADGAIRIIACWRPTGDPEFKSRDLMHIVFLKVDLQPVVSGKRFP